MEQRTGTQLYKTASTLFYPQFLIVPYEKISIAEVLGISQYRNIVIWRYVKTTISSIFLLSRVFA